MSDLDTDRLKELVKARAQGKIVATKIQRYVDDEFGIDISMFQDSDLEYLAKAINDFIATGISTDDLTSADEHEEEE